MSWLIQSLLSNRENIKAEYSNSHGEYRYYPLYDENLNEALTDEILDGSYNDPRTESDSFNDLIIVEKAIKDMCSRGLLTGKEISTIENILNVSSDKNRKAAVFKKYYAICDKVAEFLGGYFTDEGYLEYMRKEHELSENQIEVLRRYMKSEYKNKLMRKPLYE